MTFSGDKFITEAPTPAIPTRDAVNNPALRGVTDDTGSGVVGVNHRTESLGLLGGSDHVYRQNVGVYGESNQQGVFGHSTSDTGTGVFGNSAGSGFGVRGDSTNGIAVQGQSFGNGHGVVGSSDGGDGVEGFSKNHNGVFGQSETGSGLHGYSKQQFGIYARSDTGMAGYFDGSITVKNDIILENADCAEDFDIAGLEKVDPGTVMVIDSEGSLRECDRAYDKCVAGVISGAGKYKPAIVLDKQKSSKNRMPIALMGKVYCKVDASYGVIEVGDLLTTSPTLGHAMKANDPMKAFGSVIAKALQPLASGEGLIPILIALQ